MPLCTEEIEDWVECGSLEVWNLLDFGQPRRTYRWRKGIQCRSWAIGAKKSKTWLPMALWLPILQRPWNLVRKGDLYDASRASASRGLAPTAFDGRWLIDWASNPVPLVPSLGFHGIAAPQFATNARVLDSEGVFHPKLKLRYKRRKIDKTMATPSIASLRTFGRAAVTTLII